MISNNNNMSTVMSAFNDHFIQFIDDIINVFPKDVDLLAAKNSIILIRKTNPRKLIECWNLFVVGKYKDQIEKGNIEFFINKDYSSDLSHTSNSDKIAEAIDRLRNPVRLMKPEDQKKTMQYIQNLTKLSSLHSGSTSSSSSASLSSSG